MHNPLKGFEYGPALSLVPDEESGPADAASGEQEASRSDQVLRFQKSERMLHWSIAVPFMVCYATGMVLMLFFNLRSEGIARQILSWTHRIGGTAMILFPVLTLARHWREYRVHLFNIRHAWSWSHGDLKWLALMVPAFISRRIMLPEQGKFNAAEKVNFLMVLCTYPLFIATGLLVWMPESGILFWMVHVGMALIATPLMLGHIFMALINPETRVGLSGMISGYVDRHWARHHYRLWYRENFEEGSGGPGKLEVAIQRCRQTVAVVLPFLAARQGASCAPADLPRPPVPAEQDAARVIQLKGGRC